MLLAFPVGFLLPRGLKVFRAEIGQSVPVGNQAVRNPVLFYQLVRNRHSADGGRSVRVGIANKLDARIDHLPYLLFGQAFVSAVKLYVYAFFVRILCYFHRVGKYAAGEMAYKIYRLFVYGALIRFGVAPSKLFARQKL